MRLSVCVPGLAIVIGIGCGMYFGDGGYPQNQKSLLTYTKAMDENASYAGNARTESGEIRYIEVLIPEGATLWSIASSINDGSRDNRKIISDIRDRNGFSAESAIVAGDMIEVPDYDC
jgi:hypothetical protein